MTSTGKYSPGTVAAPDADVQNANNVKASDDAYARSAISDGDEQQIASIRPIFGGTPDDTNVYSPSSTVSGTETTEDIIIFGTGAVITWTGSDPTAAQIRNSGFGYQIIYFGFDEDVEHGRLQVTNFSFDGGGTPVPVGATIDKITFHVEHKATDDGGSLFVDVDWMPITVDFTAAVAGGTKIFLPLLGVG